MYGGVIVLKEWKNKKVKVGVVFSYHDVSGATIPKYYIGTIVDIDDDFTKFESGSLIAIKYINTIQLYNDSFLGKNFKCWCCWDINY